MNNHTPLNLVASPVTSKVPQVSIGMPVYNGAKFIREALDSLLAQTFTDFELIISDNASTDETEAICQEYAAKDARIRYVRQAKNLGAVANFKFVLDEAVGEYFMWAAHDDKWSKAYLFNSKSILADTDYSFAFPSFELKSIQLYLSKKFDKCVFEFIESKDRRKRVLQFLALHHNSHKCNIVYSLFRKEFLKNAYQLQNISNDGALGAVILSLGRGAIVRNALFSKRYPKLWPGALSVLYAWIYRNSSNNFNLAKEAGLAEISILFPEYVSEIKSIFDYYKPYTHTKYFKICEIQ